MTDPKVIAFDLFGTVFDVSNIPKEDVRDYVRQVQREDWAPLAIPDSFNNLDAFDDSVRGVDRLRSKFRVVTCSNLPLSLIWWLSQRAWIKWDAIVPLEASRAYKPEAEAYDTVCRVMQCDPEAVLLVSAHADGPDVEGAPNAGFGFQLIRNPGCPQTIIELAEALGC
jgi:HAD superfamily hydrolase (TIGR01493 family)